MKFLRASAFAILATTIPAGRKADAQVTISTFPAPRQIGMLTNDGNSTFGQTVIAPTGTNSLDRFAFQFNAHGDPATIDPNLHFKAYVMAWDGANERATGSVLWQSDTKVGPGYYDFLTGGILVTPNQNLVLFVSTPQVLGNMTGKIYGLLQAYGYDDYTSGSFVYALNGGDLAALSTTGWLHDGGCYSCDASFSATFSQVTTVPEPSSYALLASGMLLIGGMTLRRNRRRT